MHELDDHIGRETPHNRQQEIYTVNRPFSNSKLNRRGFLRLGGQTTLLALLAGGGLSASANRISTAVAAPSTSPGSSMAAAPAAQVSTSIRLIATDGYMSLPGRRIQNGQGVYAFGFRGVSASEAQAEASLLIPKYKGYIQWPGPIISIPKDADSYIILTNLGLEVRPDLDDSHTLHWHGFRNPNAIFDGVPEVSISVPITRDFPYYYKARVEGTYMYHCHFEDTEHVQMGMDGLAYIKANNGHAYDNDGGTTAFDREFTLLLNEVDTVPHDGLAAVQEFIWSDYKPNYWVINGRSYPDTIVRDQDLADVTPGSFGNDTRLPDHVTAGDRGHSQPISSLIQLNEGETGLLRIASLGYQQHCMQLLGPTMTVVGHDATYLGPNKYQTNSLYVGPGEARDALITAPAYSATIAGGSDGAGNYNVYWFRNRSTHRLKNNTEAGLGGMVTQVRVYPAGTLPPQTGPNQTI